MDLGGKRMWRGLCILCWTVLSFFPCGSLVRADLRYAPEPNPPTIPRAGADRSIPEIRLFGDPPSQEWTYHKTDNNLHPDDNEQQMMWLMNRARTDPPREGAWLAATGNALIEVAIGYWNVDLEVLQAEFNSYPPRPPAAFDVRLYTAAKAHCDDLIGRDTQDHNGQFELIDQAGFIYAYARGIVYAYAENALYGHAGFNIDWGPDGGDGTGVQPDRGHRLAIMSLDNPHTVTIVEDSDTNVGLAVVPSSDPAKSIGPLVITGNFCKARTTSADHYNRFLVGTVWQDTNGNDQYDPGEGMGGITVSPDHGTYYAVTADSGGYAIPITADGFYDVAFHGPGIEPEVIRTTNVSGQSVLLDLLYTSLPNAITGVASDISVDAATLNGTVVTHGQVTDYYFEYGATDAYGSATPIDSVSADSGVAAVISSLAEDTVYHFRLVAANSRGTSFGADQTLQTNASLPSPPQAITGDASNIKSDAAYLNGSIITHGQVTDYYFEYGATDAYGSATATESVSMDSTVTVALPGLTEDSVYHYRLVASNIQGTSHGADQTFQTSIVTTSESSTNQPDSGGSGGGGGCFLATVPRLWN